MTFEEYDNAVRLFSHLRLVLKAKCCYNDVNTIDAFLERMYLGYEEMESKVVVAKLNRFIRLAKSKAPKLMNGFHEITDGKIYDCWCYTFF